MKPHILANCTQHAAALGCVLLLAACDAGLIRPDAPKRIRLSSDPPGATVSVSGREIGRTPLEIRPGDVFPSGIRGFGYRYYGTLEFSKPGCEPVRIEIDDAVAKHDRHVQLHCARPAVPTGQRKPTQVVPTQTPPADGDVAARLRRIEFLRKEGLISEEEYEAARRRILEAL